MGESPGSGAPSCADDPRAAPAAPSLRLPDPEVLDGVLTPLVLLGSVRDEAGRIVDFRYVEANRAACELNLLEHDELVGRPLLDLMPGHAASGLFDRYVHVVESGESLLVDAFPYAHDRRGTDVRRYDIRAVRVGDGLSCSWTDVTERYEAMRQLAESEERLRILLENVSDVVYWMDTEGRVTWMSASVVRALGWTAEELVGRVMADFMHPDDRAATLEARSSVKHGRTPGGEDDFLVRIRHRDGHYVWGAGSARTVVGPDGTVQGVVVGSRVVQDLVEARESAQEDRDRLRAVMNAMQDPLVMLEPVHDESGDVVDFVFADVNPAAVAYAGRTPESMVGVPMSELLTGPLFAATFEPYRRVLATGVPFKADNVPVGIGRVDGVPSRVDVRTDRVGDRLVSTWRSVTDRYAAAQALSESELRYRLLAENASDVVYQTDLEGRIVWVAPSVTEALGWAPESLEGTPALDLVHPEDVGLVGGVPVGEMTVDRAGLLPVRYRTASGDHRRMLVRVRPLHDVGGEVTGSVVGLRDVTSEYAARDELEYRAFHDPLTGLRNRAWILDLLESDLRGASRDGLHVGMLFVDLDNFKVVNDSLGHVAGDDVLAAVARRLLDSLRPGDHVGRFGGDEFIVVAPGIRDEAELEAIAARVSGAVSEPLEVAGHTVTPTASIGVALSGPDATPSSLLRDADAALFGAKNDGRDRWKFFDQRMHEQAVARLTTEAELRRGLAQHEFVVHYQPIVRLADGVVVGQEALVRWQHPTRGLVLPGEFLSVAEDSGLVVEIGDEVLDQVCRLLAARPELPGTVSVNKSALHITKPGWHDRFLACLERHRVAPDRLCIEVTESAVLSVVQTTRDDLDHLRSVGVGIHVDDFGTGYSSLTLLRDLPVSGLKLDMSFTRQLETDRTARVLASGLAGLATGLGLDGLAEGIETREQLAILREQGWSHGQGYLFGRPTPDPVASVDAAAFTATEP